MLEANGRSVRISNPEKLYWPTAKITKLELAEYYLAVADAALVGTRNRPLVLKRYVDGAEAEPFYQKRAPKGRPDWLRTTTLSFPSGRTAEELVIDDAAALLWITNLGCIELHPHAVLASDLDHPNELRVDLDPGPGVPWDDVRRVAMEVKGLLEECNLEGYAKTSGSRGMHVWVRIEPRWGFDDVRRAALALAREIERRAPSIATSKWWKEERRGVFLDYNQNAKDRTTCSAYSVRATLDARVSTPLSWDEVPMVDPAEHTLRTVPKRLAERGDPHADIDARPGVLDALLELAERDESSGLGDAPWPPHHGKRDGEGPRVAPSRKKSAGPTAPKREKMPLIVIAKSKKKEAALAGLERWKARHAAIVSYLAPEDVLVDTMRGRFTAWFRIRINLKSVPEAERPGEEPPDPDEHIGWS